MANDLDAIFKPAAIAVVGASRRRGTLSYELVSNLLNFGFTGPIYPVNNKARVIHSIRAYQSVLDIPGPLDLAVIVVPREHILTVVDECGQRGVKGLVVITAGFKETGPEGAALEQALVEKVRGWKMRMIGPNCMGVINTDPSVCMAATFAQTLSFPGRVGFISQSGAMGHIILDMLRELDLGISKFASIGNKADVSGNDLLAYLGDDPETDVILLYLESFGNPFRFSALAREISRKKPIIAVKAGRTQAGARAAASHTGAIASSDLTVDALLAECGVIRTNTIEEMFDLAMAFAAQPLPASRGFAVVTNAGGPAILATDMAVSEGLTMAELAPSTMATLSSGASQEASLENPVDLVAGATPEVYGTALRALLDDPGVDSALAIFAPTIVTSSEEYAQVITEVSADFPHKAVAACAVGLKGLRSGVRELHKHSIPAYRFPESAVRALATMARFRTWRERPVGQIESFDIDRDRIDRTLQPHAQILGPVSLGADEARDILEAAGFRFPAQTACNTLDQAREASEAIGYPVALKVLVEGETHKADLGGVVLNLSDPAELENAFNQIRQNLVDRTLIERFQGVLVQEMVDGQPELIMGVNRDDSFGHLIMFGLGGTAVEVLRDVAFRIAPLTDQAASDMVRSIHGFRLLQGFRGNPPVDLEEIEKLLQRLSRLVEAYPIIDELDINPLMPGGTSGESRALDVRISLRPCPCPNPG